MKKVWLGVLCAAQLGAVASADEVYRIKPSDNLAAAVAHVRAKGVKTLELASGIYRVTDTIELDARDNGLVIRSELGKRAIIDGGVRVSGFKLWRDGIYVADVAKFAFVHDEFACYGGIGMKHDRNSIIDLYRDGEALTVAREPDTGFFKTGKVLNRKEFVFECEALERLGCRDEKGLFATGYWRWLWADATFALKALPNGAWQLSAARVMEQSYSYNELLPQKPFFVCNSVKFLNRDCEWVLDREAGKVYVKGRPEAEYVLSAAAGPLLRVKGATGVQVEGLHFRYGRGDGVEARQCRGLVFRDNIVERFGGSGIVCTDAKDCLIEGNRLRTFGYKAAVLTGGDRAKLIDSGCEFADNEVTDTGRARRTYSHGVAIGGCGVKVVRNYFHDLPSSAICMPGNNHFIASNITERVVLESDDQGGIDVFGSPFYQGNRVIHNVWRDIGRAATGLNAACGKAGVRLDDQVSGFYIYGNLFENCSAGHFGGVQIHGGRDNDVVNNVFIGCRHAVTFSPWPMKRWHDHWYPNCKTRETADVFSPVWKQHYGDLMRLKDMPNVNRITRNVVIGAAALTNGKCRNEAVVKDNFEFPAGTAVDFSQLPQFDALPPESALGPKRMRN